jgi:ATP-dependent helicase/nuclease subunit A
MYGCLQIHELTALRPAASNRHASLPQILADIADGRMEADDKHLTPELFNRIRQHIHRLDSWRRTLNNRGIADGLAQIFEQAAIRPLLNGRPDGQFQLANLELLLSRAVRFAEDDLQGVGRFLEFIELLSESDEDMSAAGVEAVDCVRIMSIHASKGLEFPIVLLVGLGKNINQRSSDTDLLCSRDGQIALRWVDATESARVKSTRHWAIGQQIKLFTLQEEARLLYVAMTRARDHLLLFGTASTKAIGRYRRRAGDSIQNRARQYGIAKTFTMLDLIAPVMMDETWEASLNVKIIPAPVSPASHAVIAAELGASSPAAVASHVVDVGAPDSAGLNDVWNRINFNYPYTTDIPAVVSVSRLKKDQLSAGRSPFTPVVDSSTAADVQTSIDRGLAVHTFLQMVDFASFAAAKASVQPRSAIGKLIDSLIQRGYLGAESGRLIDVDQLHWFSQTELFDRIVRAARDDAIRREMPMMWTLPASEVAEKLGSPQSAHTGENTQSGKVASSNRDPVMVRGIIDLLIYDPGPTPGRPVIIDYKTDQPQHIQNRLPAYREQIHLYAAAVSRLLGTPQVDGYLVFLAGHQIHHCNSIIQPRPMDCA